MLRASIKRLVVGAILTAVMPVSFGVSDASAAASGGVTITPANLSLKLAKGATQATANFLVANSYGDPILLGFSFEADPGTVVKATALQNLSLATPQMSLEAGTSAMQTITLTDSQQLAPGGQQLNLIVKQEAVGAGTVGVVPSIRLPLTVVKEDGAVARLSAGTLTSPGFSLGLPSAVTASLHNSGNTTAIPRGVITVTGAGGQVLQQGTVNIASAAVTPGQNMSFKTPLVKLSRALLPGVYHVEFSYGLGGDHPTQTVSAAFFYIAWWHIVALVAVVALAYVTVKQALYMKLIRHLRKKPPAPPVLAGRHAP